MIVNDKNCNANNKVGIVADIEKFVCCLQVSTWFYRSMVFLTNDINPLMMCLLYSL